VPYSHGFGTLTAADAAAPLRRVRLVAAFPDQLTAAFPDQPTAAFPDQLAAAFPDRRVTGVRWGRSGLTRTQRDAIPPDLGVDSA